MPSANLDADGETLPSSTAISAFKSVKLHFSDQHFISNWLSSGPISVGSVNLSNYRYIGGAIDLI